MVLNVTFIFVLCFNIFYKRISFVLPITLRVVNINQKKLIKEDSSLKQTKYWIHKIDKSVLKQLNNQKILGAAKEHNKPIKSVESNDKIVLFSKLNIGGTEAIRFIAYTMVDEIYSDHKTLYDHYNSTKKMKLKGIKYFTNPIMVKDLAKSLKFIKNEKRCYNSLRAEYKEIDEEDFKNILHKSSFSKIYPSYLEKLTFTSEEFLLDSIKGVYDLLKKTENRNQIEIKTFIKFLQNFLGSYGISKNYEEIEEFYAKNVWKLGFKHNTSRDPDKFVFLYDSLGKKRRFGYINLK